MSKKLLSFLGFLFSNKSSNHLIKNYAENSAREKLKSISANDITSISITKIYKFGHILKYQNRWLFISFLVIKTLLI